MMARAETYIRGIHYCLEFGFGRSEFLGGVLEYAFEMQPLEASFLETAFTSTDIPPGGNPCCSCAKPQHCQARPRRCRAVQNRSPPLTAISSTADSCSRP